MSLERLVERDTTTLLCLLRRSDLLFGQDRSREGAP
jgi:hypothetical protein